MKSSVRKAETGRIVNVCDLYSGGILFESRAILSGLVCLSLVQANVGIVCWNRRRSPPSRATNYAVISCSNGSPRTSVSDGFSRRFVSLDMLNDAVSTTLYFKAIPELTRRSECFIETDMEWSGALLLEAAFAGDRGPRKLKETLGVTGFQTKIGALCWSVWNRKFNRCTRFPVGAHFNCNWNC